MPRWDGRHPLYFRLHNVDHPVAGVPEHRGLNKVVALYKGGGGIDGVVKVNLHIE